ncbi:MAG: hypothetical protein ACJAQZ_004115 [Planctomycetota bacterium]|jgi:hypothetical protein
MPAGEIPEHLAANFRKAKLRSQLVQAPYESQRSGDRDD